MRGGIRTFARSLEIFRGSKFRLLVLVVNAFLAAVFFGAGLGLILPAFQLLLHAGRDAKGVLFDMLATVEIPAVLETLLRSVIESLPGDGFTVFLLVLIGVALFQVLSALVQYRYRVEMGLLLIEAGAAWRRRLFAKILRLPMEQAAELGIGENFNRFMSDCHLLQAGYRAVLGKTPLRGLRFIVSLLLSLSFSWRFTLLVLLLAPPLMLSIGRLTRAIRRSSRRWRENQGRLLHIFYESVIGLEVVRTHRLEEDRLQRFDDALRESVDEEANIKRIKAFSSVFVDSVNVLAVLVAGCIAAWYVFRVGEPVPNLIASITALMAGARSLQSVVKVRHEVEVAGVAAERLYDLLDREVEGESSRPHLLLPSHRKTIEFDAVTFTYPGREIAALREVSLCVSYGEMVAIVGRNGSGKTTLLSMIPRLLDPDSGRILLDGVDISRVDLSDLRSQVGLVPQKVVLFHQTVLENILCFSPDKSLEDAVVYAKLAQAHEFISRLPQGYGTRLGELGHGLSQGEKQRLAIARALAREPSILILDEPTSQIDMTSEALLAEALQNIRSNLTLFVSAHRAELIRGADRVFSLPNVGESALESEHAVDQQNSAPRRESGAK